MRDCDETGFDSRQLRFYEFDHIAREEIGDTATFDMLERFIRAKCLGNCSVYPSDRNSGVIDPG